MTLRDLKGRDRIIGSRSVRQWSLVTRLPDILGDLITGGGGGGGGGNESDLSGFAVSGAGTTAVNGTYCPSANVYNGKIVYELTGTNYSILYEPDYFGSGQAHWTIFDNVNFVYEYEAQSSAVTPPLTGWLPNNGSAPAPTLSEGLCE